MRQTSSQRLDTLDSFRFLSITIVVFFHYLSRWTPPMFDENYYPFGDRFATIPILKNGGVGVQFFFMISGFVILFTLERTNTLKDFFIRRWIRLWPTILLCSLITYISVFFLDSFLNFKAFEMGFKNFLPSLTFTPTEWWNRQYIDSAYWSLAVEVKFYIWAAVIYFAFKRNFVAIWSVATFVVMGIHHSNFSFSQDKWFQFFFFPQYLPFFSAGILFYQLFKSVNSAKYIMAALLVLLLLGLTTRHAIPDKIMIGVFFLFFLIFIYKNNWFNWLNRKWIIAIGVSSYPLYLLHQHLGVLLMYRIAPILPLHGNWQILYPLLMFAFMCSISYFIYLYFEIPVKRYFMGILQNKKTKTMQTIIIPVIDISKQELDK